jgi:hypothetical protein
VGEGRHNVGVEIFLLLLRLIFGHRSREAGSRVKDFEVDDLYRHRVM